MDLYFSITRDVDAKKLRKVKIELSDVSGQVIDRCRIFAGLPILDPIMWLLWQTFPRRLERRKKTMLKRAATMLAAGKGTYDVVV